MIDINLLPKARRHANDRRRTLRRWIIWGGLWCVVLGAGQAIAVSSGAVVELTPVEREIARLVEERERLDGEIATLHHSIEQGSKSLAAARAVVDHPDWSALMARVVMLRTEGLAFRRWNLAPGANGSLILRLEGNVPTLGGLTDFALRLEELKVFRKVTIVTATAATGAVEGDEARSIGFAIDAELLSPVVPKAADANGGDPLNLTARHLIGIHLGASATLVALTASWFLVGVQPLLSAKQRAATLGEEASAQRDAIRELVSKRDENGTRLASIEESLAQTTVRLKPASALNAQLAEITRLAEVEQIVVDRIEPSAMVETALATRVPVRFAGRGASPSAIRFLAAARKRFPDIAVEGFEMATQGNEAVAAFRFDCVWYADRTAERPASAAVQP